MLPLCEAEGIGVIPWSPLARGRLTRDWNKDTPRIGSDNYGKALYANTGELDRPIVERVAAIAAQRGVPRAQVALAWVLQKSAVTAPIIGASKQQHLDDAMQALSFKLTPEEVAALEQPYRPHAVAGFE